MSPRRTVFAPSHRLTRSSRGLAGPKHGSSGVTSRLIGAKWTLVGEKGTPIPPKRARAFRHLSRQLALPTTLAGDLVREKDLHERLIRHVAFVGQGLELLEQRDRQTNGDGRRGGAEVW